MALEIERKFLIKNSNWKQLIVSKIEIRQGYLNSYYERTVRVRIKGDKGILTIKGKTENSTRLEYEYEIPLTDARELLNLCEKPIIEKFRYIVHQNDKVWEIDIFEGDNKGLEVAEVELNDANETIELPTWIGEEVTTDVRYYNSNLIKHPFKNW